MRMHSIIPWPSTLFGPSRKSESESKRKARAAEQSLALSEFAVQRTPPKHEFDDEDHPGENLNIIV